MFDGRRSLLVLLALALASQLLAQSSKREMESPRDQSHLLEVGQAKNGSLPQAPSELKIVSYNIRWRGGEDLQNLAQLLKEDPEIGGASIIGLQEVDRNKKRTGNKNTIRFLAEQLGMHYAWAAPPAAKSPQEEETGVAILSSYPLRQVHRIVLPHQGPGRRRRVALGATVDVANGAIRVYSVHSETRIPVKQKLEQMKAVLADLESYPAEQPAVVLGDLNTWEINAAGETKKLFTAAGFKTPFDDRPTFSRRLLFVALTLKLDWIWVRNLASQKNGIDGEVALSDHWPLWITVQMNSQKAVNPSPTQD